MRDAVHQARVGTQTPIAAIPNRSCEPDHSPDLDPDRRGQGNGEGIRAMSWVDENTVDEVDCPVPDKKAIATTSTP